MNSLPLRNAYIITVEDGTLFHCEPKWYGAPSDPVNLRWSIHSTTTQYVGPIVQMDRCPVAVQWQIEDWWEIKNLLGQDE